MNPILQQLNRQAPNNFLTAINQAKQIIGSSTPDEALQKLMNSNPQFKQFVEDNRNKRPQEIAEKYGIDLNALQSVLN